MAQQHEHYPKLKLDTKTQNKPATLLAQSHLDEARDGLYHQQHAGGSENSATPPIEIRGGSVKQGSPHGGRGSQLRSDGAGDDDYFELGGHSSDEPLRARGSSISFDPHVRSDSGDRLPLQGIKSVKTSPPHGQSHSPIDSDPESNLPIRGRKREQRANREYTSHPAPDDNQGSHGTGHAPRTALVRKILMGSDNGFSRDSDYLDPDKLASLTSATTSPSLDEARTPLEPVTEYFMSPSGVASPMEYSASDGLNAASSFLGRSGSQRVRSPRPPRPPGSLRKSSRRSSTRSTGASPASAFLSQWGGRSGTVSELTLPPPAEPDAEGNEIGDHSEYIIGREIGRGGFSVVKEAHTFEDGDNVAYAVKIVRKNIDGKSEVENEKLQSDFEREVSVWRYLKHPYILPLHAVYDTPFATFGIMKLNHGGTLFEIVRANRRRTRMNTTSSASSLTPSANGANNEEGESSRKGLQAHVVRRYVYQLASALRYLHEDVRVVHRDVKLENCLVDMSAPGASVDGGNILLCDFGLADFITNESRASPEPFDPDEAADGMTSSMSFTIAGGSLSYAAPELINARSQVFSPAVDIWAFGVVAYALMTGELPFSKAFAAKIVEAIQQGSYDIDQVKNSVSGVEAPDDAVELIRGCLEVDSGLRWTIAEVLESRWLEGCKEMYDKPDNNWS